MTFAVWFLLRFTALLPTTIAVHPAALPDRALPAGAVGVRRAGSAWS